MPEKDLLSVSQLRTYYFTHAGAYKAVDGVSFSIREGEFFGLIGESGSGKTTTALSIMRLVPWPGKIITGEIFLEGKDILKMQESEWRKTTWKRISLVFQGSANALDPLFNIESQIVEAIRQHDEVEKSEILSRVKNLLETVGIDPSRSRNYPHEFSGGMKQRVMIAMALACNPRVVIADEPTSALDVMTAAKLLDSISELRKKMNLSMLLITHDLSVAADICDSIAVMYAGKIVESGPAETIFKTPLHPYTIGLIRAFPPIQGPKVRLAAIPGDAPILINPAEACRFHERCPYAMEKCSKREPNLVDIGEGHMVSCFLYG